jgi:hypothetical protein
MDAVVVDPCLSFEVMRQEREKMGRSCLYIVIDAECEVQDKEFMNRDWVGRHTIESGDDGMLRLL